MIKKKDNNKNLSVLSEEDREGLVADIKRLFIARDDIYLRQGEDGTYSSNKGPTTDDIIKDHLTGKITIGVYTLNKDDIVKWGCVDIDGEHLQDATEKRNTIFNELIFAGIPRESILCEESGSPDSYHIWIFFELETKAKAVKTFLEDICKRVDRNIEVFPKQATISEKGVGNGVKLPLGFHREQKKWSTIFAKDRNGDVHKGCEALAVMKACKLPKSKKIKIDDLRPCFVKAIEEKRQLEGAEGDEFRLALVNELIGNGYIDEEIHEIFKLQADYNPGITQGKIDYSRENYGEPFKCETIKDKASTIIAGMCNRCTWKKDTARTNVAGKEIGEVEPATAYTVNGKGKIDHDKLARDIMAKCHIVTLRDTGDSYYYKEGLYRKGGETIIAEECEGRLIGTGTTYDVNETINHIKRKSYIDRAALNADRWILNLNNGLYNLETDEFSEHTPNMLSTIRIPVKYDPKATCPLVMQHLYTVLYEQYIPTIEEMMGYCLYPDYPIQVWFLLSGSGNNGKSTTLGMITHLLSSDNISAVPLQNLNRRFAASTMYGKLANICADLSSEDLKQTHNLKAMTGGDPIAAEYKFKNPFSFLNTAKLIFSCNEIPLSADKSDAFFRRVIFIPFPRSFDMETVDKNILTKLTTEQEVSGFLNVAIYALKRLLKSGEVTGALVPKEMEEMYERASNPVYVFLNDLCTVGPDQKIPKQDLYLGFCNYCKERKIAPFSEKKFVQQLKTLTLLEEKQEGRNKIRMWLGVDLKDAHENSHHSHDTHLLPYLRDVRNKDVIDSNTGIEYGLSSENPVYPVYPVTYKNTVGVAQCDFCGKTRYVTTFRNKTICDICLSHKSEIEQREVIESGSHNEDELLKSQQPIPTKIIQNVVEERDQCQTCVLGKTSDVDLPFLVYYSDGKHKTVCKRCGERIAREYRLEIPSDIIEGGI